MNGSFTPAFQAQLIELMRWRRDVRRFRTDPVEAAILDRCLCAFGLAPSVGLSEPWRVIKVISQAARSAVIANHQTANARAQTVYSDEKALLYGQLKLAGLQEAPIHLAVFCDDATAKGHGLGAASMPEMRAYSVVGAINLFWLTARAEGLGVGWVSILDAEMLKRDLDVPVDWKLIGYLCVGWPETTGLQPELEQKHWERRAPTLIVETR